MSGVKRFLHHGPLAASSKAVRDLYPHAAEYVYASVYDALAQRCRELEAENSSLRGSCKALGDENKHIRRGEKKAIRERDTLRAEVERCAEIAAQNASDAGALYAEVERLQAKLRRIEYVAQCGSVQSWLALPDAAKAQWFALHLEMEDERLADAARLQWLANNMRLMSGRKDRGHYQLPELVEWVESGREGCTLDDLRAAIDALPEAI